MASPPDLHKIAGKQPGGHLRYNPIVDANTRLGLALLFAGGTAGGSNDQGLTYAHTLKTVLDLLEVDLVLA
jgi:hypothetical protein